ncbi:hypothetical protein M446_0536 [Methylobacterium sp. 4-46]|uniref:Brp/Blh family beta-carotene 15,15'-dioxygenase n=1 Tax=unclassified Methylobacterium TaxID=2615210 RepID=UPI000165C996|nr:MULTISPECIES: Brp/Blh family beta-carotene 15,15'-dioxygenase [Methylobacterium]ACA15098.1 hypothetical protein M446_0536 [Methylobacterium sp. 4-46]WFT80832.1 Brp/Blh family beta-carotene 15,15'-dioxygenase [Methylobacterium nodulans]
MRAAHPTLAAGPRPVPSRPEAAPLAVLAIAFALTGALPVPTRWEGVTALVLLFGVPHGALDGEIARPLLRPRFGRLWFPAFALPYLGLSALVLACWRVAPLATLAGFFALSVWHFGSEDAGPGRPIEALVRGGLPIAVPSLLHPDGVARLFSAVTGVPLGESPTWLGASSWLWVALACGWVLRGCAERRRATAAEMAGLVAAFAVLPPLSAFGLYFVCVHAPRHVRELVRDGRAPRVRSLREATVRALPVTLLTFAIGAALWPLYPGPAPERLVALTLQGLAALTLPHMALDALTRAVRGRPSRPGREG